MITNNYRLGVNDSNNWTMSDGYVNNEGVKQKLNPVESYAQQYFTSSISRISPWIFSSMPQIWGSDSSSSRYLTDLQNCTCYKNRLVRWFPSKASLGFCCNTNNTDFGDTFIGFGSGTTPATPQDYTLEKPLYANLKVSQTLSSGIDDDTRRYTLRKLLVTSKESDPITISELGIFIPLSTSGGTYNSYIDAPTPISASRKEVYLLEHTILDTPVILNYNETASIDYRITVTNNF